MNKFAVALGSLRASHPGAVLAPMAGITDAAMRRAAQEFGASYTVSEMVDRRYVEASAARVASLGDGPHVVQVAGCLPGPIAEAARRAEAWGAEAVDINMGCPARKVTGGAAGSALMRDLDHAIGLIRAVRAAVAVPVSVKMRLGWDDASRNAPELARRAEAEGVALVTVHGRTRCQFYTGSADWRAIRAVVEAVAIPVVANGDCRDTAEARAMLAASGAAAVMIGRAAIGRPWLVGDIAHALRTGDERQAPSRARRLACARRHYGDLLDLHGTASGVRHARKHLAGYAADAGHPAGSAAHLALVTADDPAEVHELLDAIYAAPDESWRIAA